MKTVSLKEAADDFPTLMKDVESGHEVAIASVVNGEIAAVILPYGAWKKTRERRLGTLEGKGPVWFAENFSMTDEELIGL